MAMLACIHPEVTKIKMKKKNENLSLCGTYNDIIIHQKYIFFVHRLTYAHAHGEHHEFNYNIF